MKYLKDTGEAESHSLKDVLEGGIQYLYGKHK